MSGGALSLTVTLNGVSDTTTFQPSASNNVPVQLSSLAGSYVAGNDATSVGTAVNLTVDASGGLTANNPTFTATGTLAQPTPGVNGFTVTLALTPTGNTPVNYQGLAFYGPTARTLTVMLTTSNPLPGMSSELGAVFSMQ